MDYSFGFKFLKKFKNEYLNSKSKIIEFLVSIITITFLSIVMLFTPESFQAYISQILAFIAVYFAFRFGMVGIIVSLLFSIKDIIAISIFYYMNGLSNFVVALSFTVFKIFIIIIIGSISLKHTRQRIELERHAITDDLTGVFNQRHFHNTLENEMKNSAKNNNSIGLLLIDIDNFEMYNDLYGHHFGDNILINTAFILKKIVGPECKIYRFGGDEFALLLINKDIQSLEYTAKNIYASYSKLKTEYYTDSISSNITFSIGLSEFPNISNNKEALISEAKIALYQAKNKGEDKVNFYQDIMLQIRKNIKPDQQQLVGMFKGLLSTIVAKDKYTFGHCERVSSYAVMIGEAMGLNINEIQTLLHAGLLHDIGKIELPKTILNKIGRLTEEEFELVRLHPVHSAIILEPLSGIDNNIIDYVKHHHERYDGNGYPDGLKGEEISLGARILCVADSFDAMISERPYRKSLTIEQAFEELEKNSGSQFDPNIAKLFITTMRNRMSIKYNYKGHLQNVLVNKTTSADL